MLPLTGLGWEDPLSGSYLPVADMSAMTPRIICLLIALAFLGAAPPAAHATPPLVGNFTGNVGVYVARIDPGAATLTVLASDEYQPDMAFPLASSFKPAVLYELLRDIDEGALGWRTRINIPAADQSLDDKIPKRASIRKLAKKMIKKSHNSSTDVLFKQVGLGAPTQTLLGWGLPGLRIVMPTREFWLTLSGLVPASFPTNDLPAAAAAFASASRADQIATVEAVRTAGAGFDVDTLDAAVDDFYNFQDYSRPASFDILDDVDNIATPREMVELYWQLFFENQLSAAQDKQLRKIMKRGDRAIDRRQIDVKLRYWGGKGGSDLGMLSVAGYGETRKGNHILYAILASHSTNENADFDRLDRLIT